MEYRLDVIRTGLLSGHRPMVLVNSTWPNGFGGVDSRAARVRFLSHTRFSTLFSGKRMILELHYLQWTSCVAA